MTIKHLKEKLMKEMTLFISDMKESPSLSLEELYVDDAIMLLESYRRYLKK